MPKEENEDLLAKVPVCRVCYATQRYNHEHCPFCKSMRVLRYVEDVVTSVWKEEGALKTNEAKLYQCDDCKAICALYEK